MVKEKEVNLKKTLKILNIIHKPYNLDILKAYSAGQPTIEEVAKEIGLSYKSTFLRLQELEREKIIEVARAGSHGKNNKISISSEYKNLVKNELITFEESNDLIGMGTEKNNKIKNTLIKLLSTLKENRQITIPIYQRLVEDFEEWETAAGLIMELQRTGYIKNRLEITKKGVAYLKELKN